ncbi:hypothetical protein [Nocardia vaccinii]|uniref:hypothetical protein n=1 Tax=Nocardia vaccinii TaxID=1822 RepID=UPI00082B1547|nr:hypothetical protein [Nocardia vaccinii]
MIRIEYDGQVIERGHTFRDARESNIRTLVVCGPIEGDRVELAVINRQESTDDPWLTNTNRRTVMTVRRLLSSAFTFVGTTPEPFSLCAETGTFTHPSPVMENGVRIESQAGR